MDEDDEVLELGAARGRRTVGTVTAVALVVAAGGYLLTRGGGSPSSLPSTPVRSSVSAPATPVPGPTSTASPRSEPAWPTRNGACNNTAYLPLVSARPLDRATGIRALVGDRLATVDVDTGTARPAGLPPGRYASGLVTADDGTYALTYPCASTVDTPATVVRLDRSGTLRTVARGQYGQLLSGGDRVWGVVWSQTGDTTWLDPLDGGRRRRLPADFEPLGAYGPLVVGTYSPAGRPQGDGAPVQLLDPETGHVVRTLGRETTVVVSAGLVVWIGGGCSRCRVHTYDLRTGVGTTTRAEVPASVGLWAGAVSPDRRTLALLGERSKPVPFDLGHPGKPKEIMTLDLRSGALRPVPGVVLFAKSAPGLAFSADGRWLVISLDEGTGVRLLLWRPGLPAPLQSRVRLTAKVAFPPAVAALG